MLDVIQANLLSPAVLCFALGLLASIVRTDLRFPEPLYSAITVYLLVAIGMKGGIAIAEAGVAEVWRPSLAALLMGTVIPLWAFPVLRFGGRLSAVDAAAIAAHYGSVSAVTFIAATNFLQAIGQPFEAYGTAFLAIMESPAILVGVVLGKRLSPPAPGHTQASMGSIVHEALLGRSVFLLVGGLVVGWLSGPVGMAPVEAFFVTPFQGILALFLLEMGAVAGRRLGDLKKVGPFLLAFGMIMPVLHGAIGVVVGHWVGLSLGGATLFGTLSASASYIAAPAAIRTSLPDANPTLYLTSALAITFPFNVAVGIPLYFQMARWVFGQP